MGAVIVLTGLMLSSAGFAKLWSLISLSGVSYSQFATNRRLFPGEYSDFYLELENRKPLPLPWIQVEVMLPEVALPESFDKPESLSGPKQLTHVISLLWYTSIRWKHRLQFNKRGYYPLGPAKTTSGDIFGLYSRSAVSKIKQHIIVYPRLYPITGLFLPSLSPVGESLTQQRIYQDPTRSDGIRDYTPQDSLRHIHWKTSARRQKLQVKVFEPTTTLKTAIFFAVDSFKTGYAEYEENFEMGVSTAASLAYEIVNEGNPVGLYANTRLADSGHPISIPPGGSHQQISDILEALAKLTDQMAQPFETFFQDELGRLAMGSTLIIILAEFPDSLYAVLCALKISQFKIVVFIVGEIDETSRFDQISLFHVQSPGSIKKIKGYLST